MKYSRSKSRPNSVAVSGIVIVAVVLMISPVALAGGGADAYLAWSPSPRPQAMGGAHVAIADGASGFYWNPAGVAQVRQDLFEAVYRNMSFDRRGSHVAYAHPFREDAGMALSWTNAVWADVYERNGQGDLGSILDDHTNAFTFTFAKRFTTALAMGVNLRYVQHRFANLDAFTIGFDFGVHLRFRDDWYIGQTRVPVKNLRLGATFERFNHKLNWSTGDYWVGSAESGSDVDDEFPVTFRAGGAYNFGGDLVIVALDGVFNEQEDARLHAGVEINPDPLFAIRGGLSGSDPAFGAGFRPKTGKLQFQFDYAFSVQPDQLDPDHLVSLGLRF